MSEHIALEWAGAEYEAIKSDVHDKEFLKINPKGAVPAMRDADGDIMTQNNALLRWIAQKFPQAHLTGDGSAEHIYQTDHWLAYVGGDLHPAFRPINSPYNYTTQTDSASLEAVTEAAKKRVEKELTYLNVGLEGHNYLVTDYPTIADAYAFAVSRWYITSLGKDFTEKFPHIEAFYNRMKENKAVAKIVAIHNPSK